MADFGENLRREREMRSITLQEISETTKISVRFLEALEADEFSKLPGGIFTRSFIRAYANYIGLDPEQVMAEYELAAPRKEEDDFSRLGVNHSGKKKGRIPVLPWVIAIVLLGGGYFTFRYAHRSAEEPITFANPTPAATGASAGTSPASPNPSTPLSPSSAPAATAPNFSAEPAGNQNPSPAEGSQPTLPRSDVKMASATTTAAGVTPTSASSTLAALETQNPAAPTAPAARGELVLQVAATQPSWVAVNADGKTVLERTLDPGDVRTLAAKTYFDVTTGNALGTVLTLNGVTLKPLGRYGEVKTIHLTQNDLKNSTP
ncbi:MAG: RodZ domain-containing protein [Terriglobia bacterium]